MHILRKNTDPIFEIVPRVKLEGVTYFLHLKSEYTQELQVIECEVELLTNENYNLTLSSFPIGKTNEKFSFELKEIDVVLIGQLMIIDENEVVQDYSKITTNKFNR